MHATRLASVASATCLAALTQTATAQSSLTLSPTADTTLYQTVDGSTSNGAGDSMFAGLTLRGAGLRRALIRFDLSLVPAGHVVIAARLRLHVTRANGAPASVSLYRTLAPWGEGTSDAGAPGGLGIEAAPGDATWLHRSFPSALWSTPGGDFAPTPSASAIAGDPGPVEWTASPQMLADLNAWATFPADNFGWLLQTTSEDVSSARRFGTREHADPAMRPTLELTVAPFCDVCLADTNCDGSVDGDDVIAFFTPWDNGLAEADFNNDGSVDGDDVIEFFGRWDSGC